MAPLRNNSVPEEPEPATGNYFVSTYPPFSSWNGEGAGAFAGILGTDRGRCVESPFGVYVHVPFCSRRCDFCYYLSHDDRHELIGPYVDALIREAGLLAAKPALAGREAAFVYFGGGTPSMLSTTQVRRMLAGLNAALPLSAAREVTFESVTRARMIDGVGRHTGGDVVAGPQGPSVPGEFVCQPGRARQRVPENPVSRAVQ